MLSTKNPRNWSCELPTHQTQPLKKTVLVSTLLKVDCELKMSLYGRKLNFRCGLFQDFFDKPLGLAAK